MDRLLHHLKNLRLKCRHLGIRPGHDLLLVMADTQKMLWLEQKQSPRAGLASYSTRKVFRISTSRFGTGQAADSNRTPLGLHRIAVKIGSGYPVGTVFENRKPVGLVWRGCPTGAIAHRILWLDGLEPGYNRGARVDSLRRYIYIHGLAGEPTLGRPASRGCIHMAGADLIPMFDRIPVGTLVWVVKG